MLNTTFANRYKILKKLGVGGFATVYLAKDTKTGIEVAIKIYNQLDTNGMQIFQQEYARIAHLSHQRLLKAEHFDSYEDQPFLVMPHCKEGSLSKYLVCQKQDLTEEKIAKIIFQIAEGLDYLHKKGIVHRDLKPDNVLYKDFDDLVISDFGVSQRLNSTLSKSIKATAKQAMDGYSPAYAPPKRELIKRKSENTFDIFSFGVMIYELGNKDLPFKSTGDAVELGECIPDLPQQYSLRLDNLVKRCLEKDPRKRPSALQLQEWAQHYLKNNFWPTELEEKKAEQFQNSEIIGLKGLSETSGVKRNHSSLQKYLLAVVLLSVFLFSIHWLWDEIFQDPKNNIHIPVLETTSNELDNNYEQKVLIPRKKNKKWGFRDKFGKIVIPFVYDDANDFHEGLSLVIKDGKHGFINKKGIIIISLIYDNAYDFSEGLAFVRKDKKWGCIDRTGKLVIPLIYDEFGDVTKDNFDLYRLREDPFKGYNNFFCFSDGIASVKKDEKWGFIDKKNKSVIPYIYDFTSHMEEGLAVALIESKWGAINKNGKTVIPFIYDSKFNFEKGLAIVEKNGKYGYIDRYGKEIIPIIYKAVNVFGKHLAAVIKNEKYGYIDRYGNEVIPFIYEFAGGFFGDIGLGLQGKGGKYGFIDMSGNTVIPFKYESAWYFNKEGIVPVKKNGKWGFINNTGITVTPFTYDDVGVAQEGMQSVERNGKWGFVNYFGEIIIPLVYEIVEPFGADGLANVVKDGKRLVIDKSGNCVEDCL